MKPEDRAILGFFAGLLVITAGLTLRFGVWVGLVVLGFFIAFVFGVGYNEIKKNR